MIDINRTALAETLSAMVRVPSINSSLVPGAEGEREIAEWIADRLRATPGVDVEMQDAGGGRPNVIASVGHRNGRTLMLNGHMDTVGVAGMDDPFSGRIENGRVYGRGSADMKCAMAGAIVLLEELARRDDFPGTLVVTFVADEEHSSIGTEAICREIERWKPDAALIIEPTHHSILTAHKGFAWATITTQGFAAHGSAWEIGVDAVAHMGRVLVALETYAGELVRREPHPIVGPPSMHASLIRGGQELSSYPDACELEIERRTIPGESEESVRVELQSILDRLASEDARFSATLEMGLFREPFDISRDAEIVTILDRAVREELGREPVYGGGAGWMDSALLSAAGVPTAIFGPAGDGSHGLVEWADIDSLEVFVRTVARAAYAFCSAS